MKSTPVTEIYNDMVYNCVPKYARKIVEIGTGGGALARALKAATGCSQYIGVEINEEYALLSGKHCDKVYCENIENPSNNLLNEFNDCDVVIFSDVLEHLYDPWSVLRRLSDLMPKKSLLIASIPNVQHWSIQRVLISGDFNYTDTGLLDKTHIRFFTKKTINKMFGENGFDILSIQPRIFNFPQQNEYLSWIRNSAILFDIDPEETVITAAAFQYVVCAEPEFN